MYDNVGAKIKGLAKYVAWIFICISILIGFILVALGEDVAFVGVLVMVVGPVLAWLSSLGLYGFGQLIENTDKLVVLQGGVNDISIFGEKGFQIEKVKEAQERVDRLKKWREEGWISEEEYNAKLAEMKGE